AETGTPIWAAMTSGRRPEASSILALAPGRPVHADRPRRRDPIGLLAPRTTRECAAVHHLGVAGNEARLVAREPEGRVRDVLRVAGAPQRLHVRERALEARAAIS